MRLCISFFIYIIPTITDVHTIAELHRMHLYGDSGAKGTYYICYIIDFCVLITVDNEWFRLYIYTFILVDQLI